MSGLFFPTGLFYLQSESFTLSPWQPDGHWSGEQLQMVISFMGGWRAGGAGGVTQDKIRPTNSRRQWTNETERKRMEEWKEVIKARFKRLNRDLREVAVTCFLTSQQMEISGPAMVTGFSSRWQLRFSVHHFHISPSLHTPDSNTGCVIKRLITLNIVQQISLVSLGTQTPPHLIKWSNFLHHK